MCFLVEAEPIQFTRHVTGLQIFFIILRILTYTRVNGHVSPNYSGEDDPVASQRMLRSSQNAAPVSNPAANKSIEVKVPHVIPVMWVISNILVTQEDIVIQSRSFEVQIPGNRSGSSDVAASAAERLVSHVTAGSELGKLYYGVYSIELVIFQKCSKDNKTA